ncbi:MAG TPA: FtsX-like permease family protein, partial [Pirellulales bacterium]
YQAREIPGVAAAWPVYIENTAAILRAKEERGYPIRVIAIREQDAVLHVPELAAHRNDLDLKATALADVTSRHKYGFPPRESLRHYRGELNGKELHLAGRFHLGVDFATDGNLLMTAANFASYFPYRAGGRDPLSAVDLGVVRLASTVDASAVLQRLQEMLPPDVEAFTKAQLIRREKNFWRTNAPLGYIFMVGAVMGFVVGVLICYQIIYADISDHLREFATLKAIGYGTRYFLGLVLRQCLYLSCLGFVPGALVSFAVYRILAAVTGLTMQPTVPLAIGVFVATAVMCVLSGFLAVGKLLAVDPAELF